VLLLEGVLVRRPQVDQVAHVALLESRQHGVPVQRPTQHS
jgi:hypothetical protein